ncbi:MAG: TonB-dependent receptor [Acidobacteriota bacterium]|jgi:iron complex outermembrane receptor protein
MFCIQPPRLKASTHAYPILFLASLVLIVISLSSGSLWSMPGQQSNNAAQGQGSTDQQKPAQVQAPNEVVVVTAPRIEIPLNETPAATTVISEEILKAMPRGIGAEEALKVVPGMKIDNQADGERVHISIRGQGLLTERGIRGIKVLLDGLPLNDPSGFAPDLFDVDWSTVQHIGVFRGPASALYGGGAAGGVIDIATRDGGTKPISVDGSFTYGSYDFYKIFSELSGTQGDTNYRISASNTAGDGYRDHTAFRALNLYSKFTWKLGDHGRLTAILAGTNFFNENAEGLNLGQLGNPQQANPDALTFNEYQRTRRVTMGLTGQFQAAHNQDLSFSVYYRNTAWRESVPDSIDHRTYNTPGAILQYTVHSGRGKVKNHFTVGSDMDWQTIGEFRNLNLGGAREGAKGSDQDIYQRGIGIYALDRIELGSKWNVLFDVRSDHIHNELTDKFKANGLDLSGSADFSKVTGRIGLSYNPTSNFGLYTSWGQGFLPPATEELANNPVQRGGFNTGLKPATSYGEEFGVRGNAGKRFFYDVAFFHLATTNDFGRYRVPGRPLETFYQNAGDTRRYGFESAGSWFPVDPLVVRFTYTYSDFKYTNVQSLFGTFKNVWMPNSPRNQAWVDVEYTYRHRLFIGFDSDMVSRAYVDQTNTGYAWGYGLFNPRAGVRWKSDKVSGEIMISARNAFDKYYIAFTEPDPDGNSYQPGPKHEVFISARLYLGGKN